MPMNSVATAVRTRRVAASFRYVMGRRDAGELRVAANRGNAVVDLFRLRFAARTSLQNIMELRSFTTGGVSSSVSLHVFGTPWLSSADRCESTNVSLASPRSLCCPSLLMSSFADRRRTRLCTRSREANRTCLAACWGSSCSVMVAEAVVECYGTRDQHKYPIRVPRQRHACMHASHDDRMLQ